MHDVSTYQTSVTSHPFMHGMSTYQTSVTAYPLIHGMSTYQTRMKAPLLHAAQDFKLPSGNVSSKILENITEAIKYECYQ